MQIMMLVLQGATYTIYYPEIASTSLLEDGKLTFCAGNLSFNAINQCFAEHIRNNYRNMIALPQYEEQSCSKELSDCKLEA